MTTTNTPRIETFFNERSCDAEVGRIVTKEFIVPRSLVSYFKDTLDTNDKDFFPNLGKVLANPNTTRFSCINFAILHEGMLIETHKGWVFSLPSTGEVMQYIAYCMMNWGRVPHEFFINIDDGIKELVSLETDREIIPDSFQRLCRDIVSA